MWVAVGVGCSTNLKLAKQGLLVCRERLQLGQPAVHLACGSATTLWRATSLWRQLVGSLWPDGMFVATSLWRQLVGSLWTVGMFVATACGTALEHNGDEHSLSNEKKEKGASARPFCSDFKLTNI